MSIHLPKFRSLSVEGYALYPGTPDRPNLHHDFSDGVTIIIGTNGLGKTTLINVLLRCLVGPFNPPKQDYAFSSAKETEVLWRERKSFFSRRVGDKAENANATLAFLVGTTEFVIKRSLSTGALLGLRVNGEDVPVARIKRAPDEEPAEVLFRKTLSDSVGASSYLAALQIIRHLVFVDETRRPLLWNVQSQASILRDLLLSAPVAEELRATEAKFLSADSSWRNQKWQVNNQESVVRSMRVAGARAGDAAQLAILIQQLRADNERRTELEGRISETEDDLRRARLAAERSRLYREESRSALDDLRLTAALRLFPHLPATDQYIISRFHHDSTCRACGADVSATLAALEAAMLRGDCLVCTAPPEEQRPDLGVASVADRSELVAAELVAKRQELMVATTQLNAADREVSRLHDQLVELVDEVHAIDQATTAATSEVQVLRTRLPPTSEELELRERELLTATQSLNRMNQIRKDTAELYRSLLVAARDATKAKQSQITANFSNYAKEFLAEDAVLSYAPKSEKLGQSGDRFELPRFKLDMTSAAYSGHAAREGSEDVSESQREFIDLAYRMALIDACVSGPAAFVLETPEASLDGVFMKQAGVMLNAYGARPERQMIVTSNLSSAGMIQALAKQPNDEPFDKAKFLINLFEIAAPTRAVEKYREDYNEIVEECFGNSVAQISLTNAEGAE